MPVRSRGLCTGIKRRHRLLPVNPHLKKDSNYEKVATVCILVLLTASVVWAKGHKLEDKVTDKNGNKITIKVQQGDVNNVSLGNAAAIKV